MAGKGNIGSDRALKKMISEASAGTHRVNDGLYLQVSKSGSTSWIFRFQLDGRRREMGLGTYPDVSMLAAKEASEDARRLVAKRIDPITARDQALADGRAQSEKVVTFKAYALDYIQTHRAGWSNVKHAQQWENTLTTYAFPVIGEKSISSVNTDDLLKILSPIWSVKNETASRVRNRLEAIISSAKARRLFEGENPALWKGHLETLLPKRNSLKRVKHHAALPYAEIPEFIFQLNQQAGLSARALLLVILTACRTSEVLQATWTEFDLDAAVWTIPAARMKARREHKVPLSAHAVAILRSTPQLLGSPYVFPGTRPGRPLSQMAMAMLLRRMKCDDLTVHGFRSTFRDWAAEETSFPNMVAEMALAHTVGNAVEAAYRRGDLLAKRKELMQEWADYCMGIQEKPQVERSS
ncbi:integrase [Pseudomonas syringae group genomosp. 3]|nr:integrase [Pseudomonas syringae group genomosp. 3]